MLKSSGLLKLNTATTSIFANQHNAVVGLYVAILYARKVLIERKWYFI